MLGLLIVLSRFGAGRLFLPDHPGHFAFIGTLWGGPQQASRLQLNKKVLLRGASNGLAAGDPLSREWA